MDIKNGDTTTPESSDIDIDNEDREEIEKAASRGQTDTRGEIGNKQQLGQSKTLPQLIFKRSDPKTGKTVQDKNGTDLIQVLAARIDRFAADNETWARACAFYIDAQVDRNSTYSASILVDCRAGPGWANPKVSFSSFFARYLLL